jgi:3-dehydroquinate synthase
VSKYTYSHGEAIALGMAAAAFTAQKMDMIDDATRRRIRGLIERAGLPTHNRMHLQVESIFHHMTYDKKVATGKIRLILPERIGSVIVRDDVPVELMHDAVRSLHGG